MARAERLDAGDVAVHLVDAPDECIPEWGIVGTTWGPHCVVLAVDPDHAADPEHVFSTLVHEVHHAMRWRGPGCGTSLRERLVTEGLAQAFEADCTAASRSRRSRMTRPTTCAGSSARASGFLQAGGPLRR